MATRSSATKRWWKRDTQSAAVPVGSPRPFEFAHLLDGRPSVPAERSDDDVLATLMDQLSVASAPEPTTAVIAQAVPAETHAESELDLLFQDPVWRIGDHVPASTEPVPVLQSDDPTIVLVPATSRFANAGLDDDRLPLTKPGGGRRIAGLRIR